MSDADAKAQKRRIMVSAIIMAGVAVGLYVGFIALMASR